LIDLSERIGDVKPKGAKKSEIARLPVRTVVTVGGKCSVCLSEYEIGDVIKGLPCTHRFHVECIDKWLKESRFCPM
jgi:E3 ubiquitin-protein ligase SIS3